MQKIITVLLTCLALLPLRCLYVLSDIVYFFVYDIIGYRKKVVRRNLTEAFPEKTPREIKAIERKFYRYMCDIIVETVKLLHISDEEMKRRVEVVDASLIQTTAEEGRSSVLLMGHYGNWEWVQEISRYLNGDVFKASIYRPLNSKLWGGIYSRIRDRWKVDIIPQKNAVRTLLRKENQPWICGFIADARPRHSEEDAVVPFLHHATSFIYGPEVIGRKVAADFFFLKMERIKRGYYRITFRSLQPRDDSKEPYPVMREFWREFEAQIKDNPAFWLWSHKRWKYDRVLESDSGTL